MHSVRHSNKGEIMSGSFATWAEGVTKQVQQPRAAVDVRRTHPAPPSQPTEEPPFAKIHDQWPTVAPRD